MVYFEWENGPLSNFIKRTQEAMNVTEKTVLFENFITHPSMKILKEFGGKANETRNSFTLSDVCTTLSQAKNSEDEGLRFKSSMLGRPSQHTGRLRNHEFDDFRKVSNAPHASKKDTCIKTVSNA